MTIKMVAMGVYGKSTYLADSWNRLDFFIVVAGLVSYIYIYIILCDLKFIKFYLIVLIASFRALEYCLNVENMNLSAIRTIRVLRPLRAINRIPSMYLIYAVKWIVLYKQYRFVLYLSRLKLIQDCWIYWNILSGLPVEYHFVSFQNLLSSTAPQSVV